MVVLVEGDHIPNLLKPENSAIKADPRARGLRSSHRTTFTGETAETETLS